MPTRRRPSEVMRSQVWAVSRKTPWGGWGTFIATTGSGAAAATVFRSRARTKLSMASARTMVRMTSSATMLCLLWGASDFSRPRFTRGYRKAAARLWQDLGNDSVTASYASHGGGLPQGA